MLRIDVKTVYSYTLQRGLLPYVKIQSNVRFLARKFIKWIAEAIYAGNPLSSAQVVCIRSLCRCHNGGQRTHDQF